MELSRKDFENKAKKKPSVWIYIIAAVGAFFLLLSFFAMVTTLSKPQSMDLGVGDDGQSKIKAVEIDPKFVEKAITIVVGDNNKIICYVGPLSSPLEKPKEFEHGKEGIRKEIVRLKSTFLKEDKDKKIVFIKLGKKANYKNMADILDEMMIANISNYVLIDITPEDEKLFAKK
ncbi:biopolymer transporter ExbD [Flavobacterium amniphilum]|uniref:ExbD/TolR family protein n=1 Tax=Flavobacterium amniphilum TaxID=1834035 RepID=UPI00202A03F5|nr:biopolymer transporter ExbD [Flavobacterium amniphilum]MCL9804417.1 biopolymer transporter ExbD [Flavobacterium amniphilum]